MRRPLGILALTLLLLAVGLGPLAAAPPPEEAALPRPGILAPEVQGALVALPPGEHLEVIVLLREPPALPPVQGRPRGERIEGVVRALQAQAQGSQSPLAGLLAASLAQGRIAQLHSLWIVNGLALSARPEAIEELALRPEVLRIELDQRLALPPLQVLPLAQQEAAIEPNIALVNAPHLWALGYQGQGVVVAILDTGVDASHPDLAERWRGGTNSWFDPYGQFPSVPVDLSGHGTAVMGVIVGGDRGGSAMGMAPQAQWIAARIFKDGSATTSAIHRAFQWVLDPDGDPATPDAPHVVSNSWVLGSGSCVLTFAPDIAALRAAGIVPLFAAGNAGPNPGTASSPADNPGALAVGATGLDDLIWQYSSRGPSSCDGGATIYPDLVAPGVGIRTAGLYGTYQAISGTSLATPHVAGALALLLSAAPNVPLAHQEEALLRSALDLGPAGPDNDYGWGRLDVAAAHGWLAQRPRYHLPWIGRAPR